MEFAKTESIVTVQRRFRTMYRTEPPTDKTIREWYMKFQQSGCLCAAKRRGQPRPSGETVERVRETFVRSPQKSPRLHISSTCKIGQKLGVSLPLLTYSPSAWPSRLLYRRGRKSRRDLWITLYLLAIIFLYILLDRSISESILSLISYYSLIQPFCQAWLLWVLQFILYHSGFYADC